VVAPPGANQIAISGQASSKAVGQSNSHVLQLEVRHGNSFSQQVVLVSLQIVSPFNALATVTLDCLQRR
jgi:hypothetical protein